MNQYWGVALVVVTCVIVLLIGVIRKRMEWLLNILMRGILGTIAIYFINVALAAAGFSLGVGINLITILTSGFLGIPGLIALYGIGIYQIL